MLICTPVHNSLHMKNDTRVFVIHINKRTMCDLKLARLSPLECLSYRVLIWWQSARLLQPLEQYK